jgi:hypothetical protein
MATQATTKHRPDSLWLDNTSSSSHSVFGAAFLAEHRIHGSAMHSSAFILIALAALAASEPQAVALPELLSVNNPEQKSAVHLTSTATSSPAVQAYASASASAPALTTITTTRNGKACVYTKPICFNTETVKYCKPSYIRTCSVTAARLTSTKSSSIPATTRTTLSSLTQSKGSTTTYSQTKGIHMPLHLPHYSNNTQLTKSQSKTYTSYPVVGYNTTKVATNNATIIKATTIKTTTARLSTTKLTTIKATTIKTTTARLSTTKLTTTKLPTTKTTTTMTTLQTVPASLPVCTSTKTFCNTYQGTETCRVKFGPGLCRVTNTKATLATPPTYPMPVKPSTTLTSSAKTSTNTKATLTAPPTYKKPVKPSTKVTSSATTSSYSNKHHTPLTSATYTGTTLVTYKKPANSTAPTSHKPHQADQNYHIGYNVSSIYRQYTTLRIPTSLAVSTTAPKMKSVKRNGSPRSSVHQLSTLIPTTLTSTHDASAVIEECKYYCTLNKTINKDCISVCVDWWFADGPGSAVVKRTVPQSSTPTPTSMMIFIQGVGMQPWYAAKCAVECERYPPNSRLQNECGRKCGSLFATNSFPTGGEEYWLRSIIARFVHRQSFFWIVLGCVLVWSYYGLHRRRGI